MTGARPRLTVTHATGIRVENANGEQYTLVRFGWLSASRFERRNGIDRVEAALVRDETTSMEWWTRVENLTVVPPVRDET